MNSTPRGTCTRSGFRLSRSQRGSQWGKEVNEQLFMLGDE